MKPSLYIALVILAVAGLGAASILFLDNSSKLVAQSNHQISSLSEVKWGEGSEASLPIAKSAKD